VEEEPGLTTGTWQGVNDAESPPRSTGGPPESAMARTATLRSAPARETQGDEPTSQTLRPSAGKPAISPVLSYAALIVKMAEFDTTTFTELEAQIRADTRFGNEDSRRYLVELLDARRRLIFESDILAGGNLCPWCGLERDHAPSARCTGLELE